VKLIEKLREFARCRMALGACAYCESHEEKKEILKLRSTEDIRN